MSLPQLDPQQLTALGVIGFLMASVVWLVLVGCTVRFFYLFFARTSEFAALPDLPLALTFHDALRIRTRPPATYGFITGAFVGMLVGLFHAAAAALSWLPGTVPLPDGNGLWVGFIAAALVALVATQLIYSGMMKLARRYAELERRVGAYTG